MRTALVTGGSGMVGRVLVRRLAAEGWRVRATARSPAAVAAAREDGAEPLFTDLQNLRAWAEEAGAADAVWHLGLPRLEPPLRPRGARRRAREAALGAAALAEVAAGRPLVMASSGMVYGDRREGPAAEDDPPRPLLAGLAAHAAERALAAVGPRIVRLPWTYGPAGLARDLIVGLRTGRYRILGDGGNRWSMLSADDAAAALVRALELPPGTYTAAEEEAPTQLEVVMAICSVPGHRRPDHVPPGLARLGYGGAMVQALTASLWLGAGGLRATGWAPADRWREAFVSLAGSPLPLPD